MMFGEKGEIRHASIVMSSNLCHGANTLNGMGLALDKPTGDGPFTSATLHYLPNLAILTFFLHLKWVHLN